MARRCYSNYLFEESSDDSYENVKKAIKLNLKSMLKQVNEKIQSLLAKVGVNHKLTESEILTLNMLKNIPDSLKTPLKQYAEIKESYETSLSLLDNIHKNTSMSMHFVDMPKSDKNKLIQKSALEEDYVSIRDEHMASRAEKICANGGNKQILLVGFSHYKIGHLLKKKGFIVNSFAIFNYKPLFTEDNVPKDWPKKLKDDQLCNFRAREAAENPLANQVYGLKGVTIIDRYISILN